MVRCFIDWYADYVSSIPHFGSISLETLQYMHSALCFFLSQLMKQWNGSHRSHLNPDLSWWWLYIVLGTASPSSISWYLLPHQHLLKSNSMSNECNDQRPLDRQATDHSCVETAEPQWLDIKSLLRRKGRKQWIKGVNTPHLLVVNKMGKVRASAHCDGQTGVWRAKTSAVLSRVMWRRKWRRWRFLSATFLSWRIVRLEERSLLCSFC